LPRSDSSGRLIDDGQRWAKQRSARSRAVRRAVEQGRRKVKWAMAPSDDVRSSGQPMWVAMTGGHRCSPLTEILSQDFEGVAALQEQCEQSHISSLCQNETSMARTKKVLAFPGCFFLSVVTPLYLEELHHFTPRDMIVLIQYLDGVLGVRQAASSSVTSCNTTSTGAFKHFFSCDTWKMS
jgi:hypothetical protein